MAKPNPAAPKAEKETRYVLITECLQNDLFFNPECRIFLQDEAVRQLLVAKKDRDRYDVEAAPRHVSRELLERGPLGLFLQATIGERFAGHQPGLLHVINIRDWHTPDDSYDAERRVFGRHCLAGSWGCPLHRGPRAVPRPGAGAPGWSAKKDPPGDRRRPARRHPQPTSEAVTRKRVRFPVTSTGATSEPPNLQSGVQNSQDTQTSWTR